jgi:uncharacterized protein YbaP (TraB family)
MTLVTIPLTANAASCFVWRATNTSVPCYLVGTMHALSAHDYPLPTAYDQALRDSKRLVFEMKPEPTNDFFTKFVHAATYPNGDFLERHVHPKTWEIIRANFTKISMVGRPFRVGGYFVQHGVEQLRPWAIASIFYGIPGYSDIHSRFGVDNYFAFEGKRHHKELAGLETDNEHIAVLGGLDDAESELMLLDVIVNRDRENAWDEEERVAWKRGDIAGVREKMARWGNLNPGAYMRLLDERNIRWIPKIKAEFNSGKPTSIVVGAGHMLGPNGLIALLRKNGYQFEQL